MSDVIVGIESGMAGAIDTTILDDRKDPPKRGRKAGSKVKVKGGAIKVTGPRKPKVIHGWSLQGGITKSGGTRWCRIEWVLAAKSLKTAMREAKDKIVNELSSTTLAEGETFAIRVFETKYVNLDVRLVPQAPKVVL